MSPLAGVLRIDKIADRESPQVYLHDILVSKGMAMMAEESFTSRVSCPTTIFTLQISKTTSAVVVSLVNINYIIACIIIISRVGCQVYYEPTYL